MFRSVLADRFKLAVHRDTQELPIYSLVIAKNGPKIRAVEEGDCPEVPSPQNPCRSLRSNQFGQLSAVKAPMPALALVLVGFMGRMVVDKTGLAGSYGYQLDWKPISAIAPTSRRSQSAEHAGEADPASMEPAIEAALEEQLGL